MAAAAETETIHYIAADSLDELAFAREDARLQAWTVVEDREKQIRANNFEDIPLAIDALSSAARVVEARSNYEREEAYQGLFLDCHRLLAEWRRKNTWEYFPAIRQVYSEETGDFYSHGVSIWAMTGSALAPLAETEEVDRRVNERVEEATAKKIRAIGSTALGGVLRMRTISECTDWSIRKLKDGEAGFGGYVPEIEKVMVRDIIFDPATGDRYEEQVGLPGNYISHDIIQRALERRGVDAFNMDKTQLHGHQMLVNDDLLEFVEHLDSVASEQWCTEVFMGEVCADSQSKNYGVVKQESKDRQDTLVEKAHMVADFVIELKISGQDPKEAPELVEEFVKNILLNVAKESAEIAEEIFDQKTAVGLSEVARLESIGRNEEALRLFDQVADSAPGGGYCGAGSCDLVSATEANSSQRDALKKLGFNAKDTLLDKGDRYCKKCSAKTVVYDLKKAEKGCTSCLATTKYKK